MPVEANFTLGRGEDGAITIGLQNPTNIAGWALQFQVSKYFGGLSGTFSKFAASGFGGGQSGITVLNSGAGTVRVAVNSLDTSGMDPGTYGYQLRRLDSGHVTEVTKGFFVLRP